MGDGSTNDIIYILKGLKNFTGKNPEEFADWLKKFSFILSFRRTDMYNIIEGQQRPASSTDTLTTEQAAFDQANKDLYAILFLVTEKPAALLVAKHAEDSRGTRGNGQAAMQELESKYLRITNESIRATQRALAESNMTAGQDPDEYINEATLLRERLSEMDEPITDRHFMDIILQGLTDEYKDVKLMTWKDPDMNLAKIKSVLRHVYQDEQSRKKTTGIAGRGYAMQAATGTGVVICRNCGIAGHYERGCAMPRKDGKVNKSESKNGGAKWCSLHNTTTHSNEECYRQGAAKPASAKAASAKATPAKVNSETAQEEECTIDFTADGEDWGGGLSF